MDTEQRSQVFGKLFEIQAQIIADVKKNKQGLILIVLEDIDFDSRLGNLRQSLLKSQIQNETESIKKDDIISSIYENIKEFSTQQLEDMTEMTRKIFRPAFEYRKLLDDIREIMLQKDLTSKIKVERISDLLI
jgi:hypothetical protein